MKIFKIKQVLFEMGKTQTWLSKEAKVNRAYLSLAISGRVNLTDSEKTRIANVLGLPIADLFGGQAGQGNG